MKRPYIDMWAWLEEFYRRAYSTNDRDRAQFMTMHAIAFDQREKSPERALAVLRAGVEASERLNEPWIAVSFECRIVEMLMLSLARYEEAVDMATRIVAKVSQEAYLNFPMRAWAFINLIIAYFELDALSHKDEILAMMETLETRIPIDLDIHERLYYYRSRLWLGLRDREKAMADAMTHLEMSAGNDFRASYGYELLTHLAYLEHQDRQAFDYAHLTQSTALSSDHKVALANSYYWQALLLVLQDQPDEAHQLFIRGIAEAQTLYLPQDLSLLRGKCRYYEAKGEYEASLALWDQQIQLMNPDTPHRQNYFYVFLHRCFVLRRLGRLTEADIALAKQAAQRLHKPEPYMPYIDNLADGSIDIPRY